MKAFVLSILLLLLTPLVFSQAYMVNDLRAASDEQGQESFITTQYSPGERVLSRDWEPYYFADFDPGVAPEGDYLGQAVFSPDGSKIYLTNRMSNMLTVYDWETMTVLANVPTGEWPSCLAVTNAYIVVGCQFSDHVFLYNASDYTLVDSIPTGEQPCRVHTSPDGDYAFVACDVDDVCTVIYLKNQTVEQTIENFPVYLQTVSWSTQSARNWAKYSDFLVSPDGTKLITHNGESEVQVFDISTGLISQALPVISPRVLAFSGDSSYVVCAANPDNIATAHRISWPGLSEDAAVSVTGTMLSTNEVVVDQAGTKAYLGTGNNTSTLVRFGTSDFVQFTSTYTAFWLGVTNDHQYAIGGQYRFSIIDFENETMVDQFQGKNQSWGAVSPTDYHVFGYDPLLFEGAHFFDISDPADINFRGSVLSGDMPEGDAPYRIAANMDYGYLICVNNLSYTCSILDYWSGDVLATIDLGESCYDVVTKGQYAICGGYDLNTVKVIDLQSMELVSSVACGQRPMELTLHPFFDIVYAANIKSNSISVIQLDGANSHLVTSIPCGVIGVYVPFYGIRSGVEVDPTGQYLLVAASFDDEVKIIDTETNQIVKSLAVGDFPLSISFSYYGGTACVTNLFDHTFSLISLDGENSEVTGTYSCNGEYPVDVEYYYQDDEYWLCNYNSSNVTKFDANDGTYKGQINMNAYGGAWGLEFYSWDNPVYLTVGNDNYGPAIVYKDSIFELPASASYFELAELGFDEYAIATIPGPDYISMINIDHTEGIRNIPLKDPVNITVSPSPFRDKLDIASTGKINRIRLLDSKGEILRDDIVHADKFTLINRGYASGVYFLECIMEDGQVVTRKVIRQ